MKPGPLQLAGFPALSGSGPSGVSGTEPPEALFPLDVMAELSHEPSEARYDEAEPRPPVKLEKGGVTSHPSQAEIWTKQSLWKNTIVGKLRSVGRVGEADVLANCHTRVSYATCTGCQKRRKFLNRCERLYCPECAPRLSGERKDSIEWWCKRAVQPKHVVVTVRNVALISKDYVRWVKDCWARLRRRRFARNWEGGFYSLEVTNEGRGWHLHIHALIEAKWVDSGELARQWADIVGQDFAIVKVKDVREKSYLQEVAKYAVKGSELASWTAAEIAAFLDAFEGVRTFGVFGSLYGKRTEWREWLDSIQSERGACECGCNKWVIRDENEQEWHDCTWGPIAKPNPPPVQSDPFLEFGFARDTFNLTASF